MRRNQVLLAGLALFLMGPVGNCSCGPGGSPGAECDNIQPCKKGLTCRADSTGLGRCCATDCGTSSCTATGCDETGACIYLPASCTACTGDLFTVGVCDSDGGCAGTTVPCPSDWTCLDATKCGPIAEATGSSTSGGSGGATSGGATSGGATSGGTTTGGSTTGGATSGGATSGGTTTGGSTSGGTTGGTTDAGPADGGTADGGTKDGGTKDGGTKDGGATDAGATDGGTTDGGTLDAGAADGGTTGGGKGAGAPCAGDSECASSTCGVNNSSNGHCCMAPCSSSDPTCGASDCDATGACSYPPAATACGTSSCTGSDLTQSACDGAGACVAGSPSPCPNHFGCGATGTCQTTCGSQASDCASGYYCVLSQCVPQLVTGACNGPGDCVSGICGTTGVGHCCTATCDSSGDAKCQAADCDNATGACSYPDNQTACGTASCTGSTFTPASTCDGAGQCQPPATSDCTPYICGANACLTSCTSGTSCVSGDFCDALNTTCCSGLASGGTLGVDGTTGSDATPCCGIGTNGPCQTLTHAMALIDAAQAQNVTINATVNGGGGDWTSAETYPVVLGWGVELSAPGVFFLDPIGSSGAHQLETFDVALYSTSDTVGYASIVGSATSPVGVGMDSAATQQTDDVAAIAVETGNTLYIANASVNGSVDNPDSSEAFLVAAGATLVLGQDQSSTVTGTVTIGNTLGAEATDGKRGIVCATDGVGTGCTVQDATLASQSSVVIEGQEALDLDAEDFASISLTSSPVIGVPPLAIGFNNCPQKRDAIGSQAVLLNGQAVVTFNNGTVQCLGGTGFLLQASPNGNGAPTLNLDSSVIQNVELGILATAGTATVTNTTLNYNVIGVAQAQDSAGNNGSIDLSGGGNTVICSSNQESSLGSVAPGIDLYNTSTANLNASNVAWDTASPDYFDCDVNFSCTCNIASCATTAGSDDMDAVEDSTALGGITTTNPSQSTSGCN